MNPARRAGGLQAAATLFASAMFVVAASAAPAGDAKVKARAKPPAPAAAAKPLAKAVDRAVAKAAAISPADAAAAVDHGSLTPLQLEAAERVYIGTAACRGDSVQLQPAAGRPGHFEMRFRQATYALTPQPTTTGAVRLEDRRAGVVWLQIPAKSMLFDAKAGQRLADDCLHAEQRYHVATQDSALGIVAAAALRGPVPEAMPACQGLAGRYFDSARASLLLAPGEAAPIACAGLP